MCYLGIQNEVFRSSGLCCCLGQLFASEVGLEIQRQFAHAFLFWIHRSVKT